MRMVPPYSDQAKVWVELLKYFQFKKVIFLGGSDQEGRAILSRFQNLAEDADIEVMSTVVTHILDLCFSIFLQTHLCIVCMYIIIYFRYVIRSAKSSENPLDYEKIHIYTFTSCIVVY